MIQDIGNHKYHVEYTKRRTPEPADFCIAVRGRTIYLVREKGSLGFLTIADMQAEFRENMPDLTYLFALDEQAFYLVDPQAKGYEQAAARIEAMDQVEAASIGELRELRPMHKTFAAITAVQLHNWYSQRKFCGRCGHEFVKSENERAMICPECNQVEYPKICPAVIIAVCDGDRVMMTKYAGREYTHYALIAGFVEIGEAFEDCVRREVMEEVGLRVKDIRYYKSQPWSFSDTILAGFFCRLDGSDETHMDTEELSVCEWKHREEMSAHTDGISLTGEMMEAFRTKNYPFYEEWEGKVK